MHTNNDIKMSDFFKIAATRGYREAMRWIGDINIKDSEMQTLMHVAAQMGDVEGIKALKEAGLSVEARSGNGSTPLFVAAFHGQVLAIRLLKSFNANVNTPAFDGSTPVLGAAQQGFAETVRVLQELGADINTPNEKDSTPIFVAATEGHLEVVKTLVGLGAVTNRPTKDGAIAVCAAAQNGYAGIIAALNPSPADVNFVQMPIGLTPLDRAAINGHVNVINLLKKLGAEIDHAVPNGVTPLYRAVENGHVDAISVLVNLGANVHMFRSDCGTTLVSVAAQNGCVQAISKLITLKVDVHKPNFSGATPFFIACEYGQSEAALVLKEAGVKLHVTANDGTTPVCIAAYRGHAKVIRALRKAKVDLNIPMKNGETPAYVAALHGHANVIHELWKAKVDLTKHIFDGVTPAYVAALHGHANVIRKLLDLEVDIDVGRVYHAAIIKGHAEVIRALKGRGINTLSSFNPVFAAVSTGNVETVGAFLENNVDIAFGENVLRWAIDLVEKEKRGNSAVVQLLKAHVKNLKSVEEKKEKEEQQRIREFQRQEKADQQIKTWQMGEARRAFSTSLQHKLTLLKLIKHQGVKELNDKRKTMRADIFANIGTIIGMLSETLEGNPNNKRLALLRKDSTILNEACELNDKIKVQGKDIEVALKAFEALVASLQLIIDGSLPVSEKVDLETRYPWVSKVNEAFTSEASDAKNKLLEIQLPYLQSEWDLVEAKLKGIAELMEQLNTLHNVLNKQWDEDVKNYRVLKENGGAPKKEKFNKKKVSLTEQELEEIKALVKAIEDKIKAQQEADAIASQAALERARQLKKAMASRNASGSTVETSSAIASCEQGVIRAQGNAPVSREPREVESIAVPRRERRIAARTAYVAGQMEEERKIQQDIRCLYAEETAECIAKGLFPRPLPRVDAEVKAKVEHSDLLIEELGVLRSVVNLLESNSEWTSEMRYALLGSFARVNEVIGHECRDASIVKIAKGLRNAIFKHYETIQAKRYSDIQWLGIVKVWIQFYEKPKLGMFDTEKGVLAEINSPLLSSFYQDISALKREMDTVDFSQDRSCLTDMQQYFASRNKEDDNVISYSANLLFLGVTGAKFKALRALSKDKPEAVLVMKEFELLSIYASQIIAEGANARHPKAPVLYLHGLGTRQEMNVHYADPINKNNQFII